MKGLIKKILHESDDFDWIRDTVFVKPGNDSYVIILRDYGLDDRLTILEGLESLGYYDCYSRDENNRFVGGPDFCYLYLETFVYDGDLIRRSGLSLSHDSCGDNVESKDYFQNYVVITPEQMGISLH